MTHKTVLLDCDGVLCDFIGGVLDLVHKHGGPRHTHDDVTEFNFTKALNLEHTEIAAMVKREISNTDGWWLDLAPFPEALEGVRRLQAVADVYIVTSPWRSCRTWLHDREAWLRQHFDIPHSHVLAGSAKHLVAGDVFVDDKTETLVQWEHENGSAWEMPDGTRGTTFAVQWQTPHNRRDEWHGLSTRSWSELLEWCR